MNKHINYAHRGASAYAPENTLQAFYKALEMGADGIETDIQLTKDGVAVLCHDEILGRCIDEEGRICDHSWEELSSLTVKCPKHPQLRDNVCSFEEFLRHFGWRDLTFAIELKFEDEEKETLELLNKYGLKEKCFITSFSFKALENFSVLDPGYRLGWLKDDFSDEDLKAFRAIGGAQLCPNIKSITKEKTEYWNSQGFSVRAWGIGGREDMIKAIECGTDGQTIDWPDMLSGYLKEN